MTPKKQTIADIIMSEAWECGDKDCQSQWHQADYWLDDDTETGYTVDHYADGDHEEIEEKDLPTPEEIDRSWRDYARYVASTGLDPLGNYLVKRSIKARERWQFRFSPSILGYMVVEAKHAGKLWQRKSLPAHVRRYLNLPDKGAPVLGDFRDADGKAKFEEMFPKYWQWNTMQIEYDKPRNPATVRRELIAAAKR